ncbi:MAG: FtsX-like permease family protein [Desulfobacterales bacterium]|nr:FtsX-like permease family protein [Desulfobacterales bacterium]
MTKSPPIVTANLSNQQSTPIFGKHQALFLNALKGLLRNPVRNIIVILCLIALLSPFVTAITICEGVKSQYSSILREGCDVYVARDNYGSNAPIELSMMGKLKEIQGVTKVVPRVIGRTYVRGKFLAILGIGSQFIPSSVQIIKGRLPGAKGEVILGWRAAEYLELKPGSEFTIERNPGQNFRIVGLFRSTFNVWNADLLVMNFEDASDLFGIPGKATDLLVFTRPGYEQIVDIIIHISDEETGQPLLRVQTTDLIDRYSKRGFNIKAGVFAGFYCLVFALGIPAIGVISGFGQSERRREIGVMKALGWQTPEVLEMVALENLILGLISVPCIILAATGWIHIFNGAVVSKFFIANLGVMIPFSVPSEIFPIPFVLCIMMAVILTMVGSIYSTWRTAIVSPSEAMKT